MFYDLYLELCKKKGISPTRAAVEIGLSKSTPTTWKKRELTPQGDALNKIAAYFDVSTDYLLGNKKAPAPEGERRIVDKDIMFAFWGDSPEMDKEDLEDVRRYAEFVKARKKVQNN